jgi:hypothetical protein
MSAPQLPYNPFALFESHWPKWDIYAKEPGVVTQWEWIQSVRLKTGDYNKKLDAFPIMITEHANSNMATTTTRIYVPAHYRPILRLLNSKMAWHQVALTMPMPMLKRRATSTELLVHKMKMTRYEVWIDGAMRNIIYCNSIRESFFDWIEQKYYMNRNATGKLPTAKRMSRVHRCNLLETWLMLELIVQGHVLSEINHYFAEDECKAAWNEVTDVFELGAY